MRREGCYQHRSAPNQNGSCGDTEMAKAELPSPHDIRQLVRYEKETGRLFWKERPLEYCASEAHQQRWNATFAGKETFLTELNGYRRGCVLAKDIFAHRAIWAIEFGEWPDGQIDHIDGNRMNNRIENLRAVSVAENQRNRATPLTNKTGTIGIRWVEEKNKFRVSVGVDGDCKYIGFYRNLRDAEIARNAAERALGYHENHGRKALIAEGE